MFKRGAGQVILVDERLFRFLLDLEVHKAIRLRYCFSVLCATPDFLLGDAPPSLIGQIAGGVLRWLRATDSVTTIEQSFVALLLINADLPALPLIHNRVKEELEARPLATGARERRATWSAGGGSYPQTAPSGSELLRQAIDLTTRAKEEGGDRLYLPS
jgi:hypothetical protein